MRRAARVATDIAGDPRNGIRVRWREGSLSRTFQSLPLVLAEGTTSAGRRIASTGKGASVERRLVSAVFEVLERKTVLDARPHRVATFREIADRAIEPEDVTNLPAAAAPLASIEKALEWSWGRAPGGRPKLVHRPTWVRPGRYPPSTNGTAAGLNSSDARLSALFELAERDAVLLHWHGRVAAPLLPAVPAGAAAPAAWLDERGFDTSLHACNAGVPVPVVLAVARSRHGREGFVQGGVIVGCAAAATCDAAAASALLEIVQGVEAALFTMAESGGLADFEPALARYLLRDSRDTFAFLQQPGREPTPPSALNPSQAPLDALVAAFKTVGLQAMFIDRPTRAGVHVSEAIAEGIQRLAMDGTVPVSGRLRRLAGGDGTNLNLQPHPIA